MALFLVPSNPGWQPVAIFENYSSIARFPCDSTAFLFPTYEQPNKIVHSMTRDEMTCDSESLNCNFNCAAKLTVSQAGDRETILTPASRYSAKQRREITAGAADLPFTVQQQTKLRIFITYNF